MVVKSAPAWARLEVRANDRKYRTRTGAQRQFIREVEVKPMQGKYRTVNVEAQ